MTAHALPRMSIPPPDPQDISKLRDKLLEHLPHAVLVGMSNPNCKQLLEDVRSVCEHIFENNAQ